MTKIAKFLILASIILMLVVPAFSFSAGLVDCDGTSANPCGFKQILDLVNKVINFVLVNLVVPIAAVMFAYAGFELVTSGGSTEKRGIAKKVFTNTVIGLIIAVACWLIIKTILSIIGYKFISDWFLI